MFGHLLRSSGGVCVTLMTQDDRNTISAAACPQLCVARVIDLLGCRDLALEQHVGL